MTPALWWRQIRSDAAAVTALTLVLAGTIFFAVAGPRWLNQVDDDAVRYAIRTSPDIDDVLATYDTDPVARPDMAGQLLGVRDDVLASLREPLGNLVGPAVVAASFGPAPLLGTNGAARQGYPIEVNLRAVVAPSPPVRYVSGRAPAPSGNVAASSPRVATSGDPTTSSVVEVALSQVAADAAELEVGDIVTLGGISPVLITVVGILEPLDPHAYFWERQRLLLTHEPVFSPDGIVGDAVTALVPPESFDTLLAALASSAGTPSQLSVELQFPIVVDDVDAGQVEALTIAANRAESTPLVAGSAPVRVSTSLQTALDGFTRQHATAYAVLSIAVAGLLVSALSVVLLAARLLTERRGPALALARARGASLRQLVVASAAEAGVAAVVGGAVGTGLALALVRGRPSGASWWLAGALVVATVGSVGVTVAVEHRTFARMQRAELVRSRPTPRRIAAEFAVVVVAAGGVALVRRRGLGAVGASVDPYLVTMPVLVALATALVVLRIYPLPLGILSRIAARRRGLVGFLGIARAGRETASASAPVVVILIGLSFSVFSAVILTTVRGAQDVVSWESVGADLRIDGTAFDPLATVPLIASAAGVGASDVFGVNVTPTATVRGPTGAVDFDLLLLEPLAYEAFVAGHPIDTRILEPLIDAPPGAGERVPALVSPGLQAAMRLATGDEVPFYLPGDQTVLDVLGAVTAFPGYGADEVWAIARTSDAKQVADLIYAPAILLVNAPAAAAATTLAPALELQPFATVTSRAATYDAIAQAPLVRSIGTAFAWAVGVALAYCLLAVLLALVVAARPRNRFLSYLRTLGLSDRQARWLVGWEVAPPTVVATAVGAGLGLLLPRVVLPAIDLRPFTSGVEQPQALVNGTVVGALCVGLLVVVTVAVLTVTTVNRQRRLGTVLRVGEES